jgi:hypothetical protein
MLALERRLSFRRHRNDVVKGCTRRRARQTDEMMSEDYELHSEVRAQATLSQRWLLRCKVETGKRQSLWRVF